MTPPEGARAGVSRGIEPHRRTVGNADRRHPGYQVTRCTSRPKQPGNKLWREGGDGW